LGAAADSVGAEIDPSGFQTFQKGQVIEMAQNGREYVWIFLALVFAGPGENGNLNQRLANSRRPESGFGVRAAFLSP
jgi:hypothetical protein